MESAMTYFKSQIFNSSCRTEATDTKSQGSLFLGPVWMPASHTLQLSPFESNDETSEIFK
jgi:hypothetical protein